MTTPTKKPCQYCGYSQDLLYGAGLVPKLWFCEQCFLEVLHNSALIGVRKYCCEIEGKDKFLRMHP